MSRQIYNAVIRIHLTSPGYWVILRQEQKHLGGYQMKKYYWFVNLDERGEFNADVRTEDGKTIYEVKSDELDGHIWQMEDGYMKHSNDLNGLTSYLKELKIIPLNSKIVDGIKAGK
jgi:hypothetical protein